MTRERGRPYHHGNLRSALIEEALRVIEKEGTAALSLRDLAKRLGVSHAAPAYHFPDKRALLTAIAAQGFETLAQRLESALSRGFLEVGLAYVRFAVENPAYIAVMYQPTLLYRDDAMLAAARERAARALYGSSAGFRPDDDARRVGLAGWCLMHGVATLWLGGNLDGLADDPVELARALARTAFDGAPDG